jgi:DNA-binding SARP family transcriptional activator/DNA-binding XRE family transcriptional regulator
MDKMAVEHPPENPGAGALGSGWAAQVRAGRRAAGLTQQQLAEAAGVSVGALRDLEQDRTTRPRGEFVRRLSNVLGLAPDQPDGRRPAGGPARGGTVRLRVLGPLAAWRGSLPVELGAARQRAVLGLLALRPNVAVHREAIIEALWSDDVPAAAVKMVQIYVGRLRRQLDPGRPPGDRGGLLVSSGTRYLLRADARQLDLIAFGRLADRARQAGRRGDAGAACDLYAEALGLWLGEPLADLDLLSAHPAVIGLAGRRADVVADFAETATAAGLHAHALPYLQAAAERDPLDERAHAWLMIALAGTGQQAAALAVYDRLRQRLDAQLGVRPGPVLAQAQERVLRQEVPAPRAAPAQAVAGAAAGPAPEVVRAPAAPPRQLPRGPGAFVGREAEFAVLRALAEQAGEAAVICVIDGVAGIGKTAFAIHAGRCLAEKFPDGQLYADLRGFSPLRAPTPPAEALTGFLRALGVDPRAVPGGVDEQAGMYRSLLDGRRMLIVLDNAADPGQVRPLLPGSPGTLILVTSRGRLSGLTARDGARRLTLQPLEQAEATLLLGRILGPERVSAEPEAASEISVRCGHLPLALRIVADRAADRPCVTLADLAGQLAAAHGLLDVLDSEDEATAIRAVFSWSYQALAPAAARVFRLLGLHPGPDVSVPAAAALAALGPAEAGRLLDLLAGVHLVEGDQPGRYRLHDLLRVYATEQVRAAGTAGGQAAIRRMLIWYLHTAVRADQMLVPGRRHPVLGAPPPGCEPLSFSGYEQALAWCDTEYANLTTATRLAAEAGHDDVAWQFPVALRGFFDLRRPWAEGLASASAGVAAARRSGNRDGQAWTLDCLGHAHSGLGQFEEALDCYAQARNIRRETGDRWGESANSMVNLGCTYLELSQPDLALDCFQRVLAAAQEAGNKYVQSLALVNLAETYTRLARADDLLACSLQAVQATREIGYRQAEGTALGSLAAAYRALGQPGRARDRYHQALAVRRQAGDRHGEAEILRDLGDLSGDVGHRKAARRSWVQALAILEGLGDDRACAEIRDRLGATA